MRLPPIKRFLMEDFQTQSSWISYLLVPLNLFMNVIANGLANGMTIQENMLAQIQTILVSGATAKTSFPWNYSQKPIGCIVISATKADGTVVANPPVTFSYSQGVVTASLTGLSSTDSYNLTFYVMGG